MLQDVNLDSKQSFTQFLFTSQLHSFNVCFSSLDNKLGQQAQSEIEIVGGTISANRHIIAGIHSHKGTHSGGAHLKIFS